MSAKLLPDAAPIASRSAPEVKGKGKLTSSSDPRLLRHASSSSTTQPPPIEKYMRLTNISPSPSREVKLSTLLWTGWRSFIWHFRLRTGWNPTHTRPDRYRYPSPPARSKPAETTFEN